MSALNVFVDRGVARLTGEVYSYRTRRQAEDIAYSTTGVKTVSNEIEVKY